MEMRKDDFSHIVNPPNGDFVMSFTKRQELIVYAPFSVEAVLFLEMIFTDSSKMLISKQRMS